MRSSSLLAVSLATAGACAALLVSRPASAATLQVGAGQTYATPCAAISAASAGDEIDIQAATYHDTCAINTAGLHLKGVGGQPKIDITGTTPSQEKGVYTVVADDVIIENLELTGAAIDDEDGSNGAGLRIEGNGDVVTNCYIHDNQNGILANPATADQGTITISHTEFKGNGLGDGCDTDGCTHNVYVGNFGKLIFQFNYSHALASDLPDKGHLLKSRAVESDILYNKITDETSSGTSYEIDLPNAGLGIVIGNVIEKGMHPGNPVLLAYGEEGAGPGTNQLYVAYNTFVNDSGGNGPFINVSQGMLATVHDNIFDGKGALPAGLSADNLSATDPLFVNPTSYDYHLQASSPAAGKGVAPGSAGGVSLTPVFEYVDALGAVSRLASKDVGAFEIGTNVTDPSSDAGAESPDGSVTGGTGADGGGTGADGGTGTGGGGGATGTTDAGAGGGTAGSGGGSGGATLTDGGQGTTSTADGGSNEASGGDSDSGGCVVAPGSAGNGGGGRALSFLGLGLVTAAMARRRRSARGQASRP